MSALVWSVESVLIGLWALVLVQFAPSPFHTFIARAQLAIAGATLLMQLINAARALPVAHAISEAYVCGVSGLFLAYVMVLLDAGNYANRKLFSSMGTAADFLPVDACVALGWFSAALVGGVGMALSERGRPSALMFHHFGYHMLVVLPSFLVFWLYNYDGESTAEPLSRAVQFLREGVRITHFIYTMLLVGLWGGFIVLQAMGEALIQGSNLPSFSQMTAIQGIRFSLSAMMKLVGRCACILIPLSAVFTVKTTSQANLSWALVAVGAANAFDWLQILERLFIGSRGEVHPPKEEEEEGGTAVHSSLGSRPFDPAALRYPVNIWRDKAV